MDKRPTLVVFCDQCYSWTVETDSKKRANVEAVSHMTRFAHNVHIITKTVEG